MRKIIRKILHTDLLGEVLSSRTEQLTDDEAGTIEESHVTAVSRCEACRRPLEKIGDSRGACVLCGRTGCSTCLGRCAVCQRLICGQCGTGFAEKNLSVCPDCLPLLRNRQAYQDRLQEDKIAFERQMALLNTKLKLIQLWQQEGGSITELVSRIAEIRVTRKIARLEQQVKGRKNHGR